MKRAVALGIFDGVHLGHRAVLENTLKSACIPAAFTFKNNTLTNKQGRCFEYIYPDMQKIRLLKSFGITEIYNTDFTALKDMSGEEFVIRILRDELEAGVVTCGRDFRFGRNASCGVREMAELSAKYSFSFRIADDVLADGEIISSGRIRSLLKNGDVVKAGALLGEDYIISKEVVHGNHIGRKLNFPTINQLFSKGEITVKYGVYASETDIDGVLYKSITSVGVKPTVSCLPAQPSAETHILGFRGDMYGRLTDVRLKKFLRPERKFESLDELKASIENDVKQLQKD